jgi:hypothetical protein
MRQAPTLQTSGITICDDSTTALARRLHADAGIDPGLSRVITAWPALPDHIRAAVLALIGAAPQP